MSDEWVETQLTDCVEVLDKFRCPVSAAERASREGNVPYYGATGRAGWIDESLFDEPLVLLGEDAVDFGNPAASKAYFVDGPSWVNNHAHVLRCDLNLVAPKVLVEALNLMDYSPYVSFGTRSKLTQASMRTMRLTLPPLSVQARIVDLVEHLDTLIANLEQERDAAEALLVALRRDFFEGLDEVVELSKVLDAARAGGTPDRKRKDFYGGDIPWLKSGEVNNSFIQATEESLTTEGLSNSSAWLVPGGAVVVAMYGATAATVGFTGLAMAMNQAILALTPDSSKADARFLYHWMCYHSPRLKESATGAAQPNLSKAVVLREIDFPAMSLEDQAVMSADLDAALATMDALREEVDQLSVARSATLTSLLSREIEIPESYDELLGVAS